MFAAVFFADGELYRKAEEVLSAELEEQVLPDGGHFERTPMYHQIILDRLLDCVNLLRNNDPQASLLPLLSEKAALMLGWLRQMTFANGDIPLVNDAAHGIAPASAGLFDYARRLGVAEKVVPLRESGYRMVRRGRYEIVVDVGNIGPDYIPGHAHSDTLGFVLYVDGRPFIVDTGTSTYETNARRLVERGTAAHNTVEVDGLEQSEVWGSFRVARRAYVEDLRENAEAVSASHTGYRRIGVRHQREFRFGDTEITIIDSVSAGKAHRCRAVFHFYPSINLAREGDCFKAGPARIAFAGSTSVEAGNFSYAPEFNRLIPAQVVMATFTERLVTTITLPPAVALPGGA